MRYYIPDLKPGFRFFWFGVIVSILLLGCASGPRYAPQDALLELTPDQFDTIDVAMLGQARVIWGGAIIALENLEAFSEIEVIAFPLDARQRPQQHKQALGRFILRWPGYLEAMDYTQGRLLTINGMVTDWHQRNIGAAIYTYPIVMAEDMYLWPAATMPPSRPRLHIGIGVMLGK